MLLHDKLPKDVVDKIIADMRDPDGRHEKNGGQNLIWTAQQLVWRGVILNDMADITRGMKVIEGEVAIKTDRRDRGIKPDMAWHDHGPQLYNGAYGLAAAGDLSTWGFMTAGLSFGFAPENLDLLESYLLDGTGWMVYTDKIDPSAMGRILANEGRNRVTAVPKSAGGSGNLRYIDAVEYLATLKRPRSGEAAALAAQIRGTGGSFVTGNKDFFYSEFMIHRRENYYVSVKAASSRVSTQETGNNQNTRGRYLSYGAQYILTQGDEYLDIFTKGWDWARVPGVTAFGNPTKEMLKPESWGGTVDSEFVGGASDGTYGAFGMDLLLKQGTSKELRKTPPLTGKKSWFFFDREFVALGAGITSDADDAIVTTVNQTFQRGDITMQDAQGAAKKIPAGDTAIPNCRWIHQRDIGYIFPGQQAVAVSSDEGIFTAVIEHGTKPSDASYAYIVVPNADAQATRSYAEKPPVEILANTPQLQAVRQTETGVTQAVFYEPGRLEIEQGHALTADQPCVIVYVEGKHVAAANPLGRAIDLKVTLERKGAGSLAIDFAGLGLESQTRPLNGN